MEPTDRSKPSNHDDSSSSSSSPSLPKKTHSRSSSSSSWSLEDTTKEKRRKNTNDNFSSSGDEEMLSKKRERSSSQQKEKKKQTVELSAYKGKISIPGFDGPLITESLFKELQLNSIPSDVIAEAYKDYKAKYENKKYQSFYAEHKNDEWFKEKYHPDIYYQVKEEQNVQCQKLCSAFVDDIKKLSDVNLTYDSVLKYKNVNFSTYDFENEEKLQSAINNEDDDKNDDKAKEDISDTPYFGFEPDKMTLFIHQLPRQISRMQIIEISKKVPGFVYLSLSEPIKNQDYNRYSWITFDTEENCNLAYDLLHDYKIANDFKLNPIKSVSITSKNIRITPKQFINRIEEDVLYTKQIIDIMDKDKCIKNSPKFEQFDDKRIRLDLQILYLRKIHGFCYYCFEFYDDERNLSTKCDNAHIRNGFIDERGVATFDNISEKEKIIKFDTELTKKAKDFIAQGDIVPPIKPINYEDNKDLAELRQEYCKNNTITVSSERFRCNICEKLFKGPNFVYNHIMNKHMKFIKDMVDKNFSDEIKKENYLKDTKKNYERIKVMNDMEEYLSYLNAMKKYQGYDSQKRYHNNRDSGRENVRGDGRYTGRRHGGSYKDYDEDRKSYGHSNNYNQGRKLISYDDL